MPQHPRSIINLSDAGIIRITTDQDSEQANEEMGEITPLAEKAGASILTIMDDGRSPWAIDELIEIIQARDFRQFIIVCETLSTFATGLCMMALEKGYHVYFVCHRLDDEDDLSIARLTNASATVMRLAEFVDECRYSVDSAQ